MATAVIVGALSNTVAVAATADAAPPRYVYPVPGGGHGGPHAGYAAADIFRACGAIVVRAGERHGTCSSTASTDGRR